MAFVENFTATQVLGSPSEIVLTDTSTGSDVNIVSRRVSFQTNESTYLVPDGTSTDYVVWPIADTTQTDDVLDKDYALYVTVEWIDINGDALYTKVLLRGFTSYNEDELYLSSQMEAANQMNISDNSFLMNQFLMRNYVDSGNQALERASDITTAQICYDQATILRTTSQYTLNVNS